MEECLRLRVKPNISKDKLFKFLMSLNTSEKEYVHKVIVHNIMKNVYILEIYFIEMIAIR